MKILAAFKEPYIKINTIFGVIIILMIIYSAIFSANKNNHPVPSFYQEITGEVSVSSGLSRSFSEITRGNFTSAKKHNVYGIRIFVFFIVQFFLRAAFSFMYFSGRSVNRFIVTSDCCISIVLFVYFFWPFLKYMAEQINH